MKFSKAKTSQKEAIIMPFAWNGEYILDGKNHLYHLSGVCPDCGKKLYSVVPLRENRTQTVFDLICNDEIFTMPLHRFVWMIDHKRLIPPGYAIYHVDHNKGNNSPSNLICVNDDGEVLDYDTP
jgi:hypothetical protein